MSNRTEFGFCWSALMAGAVFASSASLVEVGCSGSGDATGAGGDGGAGSDGGLSGITDTAPDASDSYDGQVASDPTPSQRLPDAGYTYDGGTLSGARFATKVVSFTPGGCAGFGAGAMPNVVFGPPFGAGDAQGGLDVVSLGAGGTIVLGFDNAIVDGPGDDFIVFENAFFAGGNPMRVAADLGEVSVSDDGTTWQTFPCTATAYPYGACAGWHPVYSSPDNGISPVSNEAGGDRYDLSALGVAHARFVRIRDVGSSECPSGSPLRTVGFDLDAIALVNAEVP